MSEDAAEEKPEWISPKLVEALICPASGGRLLYDRERAELVSKRAALAYPIRSGIPIMLIDEARKIDL
ncbi:MAG: Trm112 family protein [Pseudomonadota bacterium]